MLKLINFLKKIKRLIRKDVVKYDGNNNCIYYKKSSGYEVWRKYDKNNNLIHYKNSDGYEVWEEYNKNNNLIHYKDSTGLEYWYKWDNGEEIEITEKEFKNIEFRKKEKEYNSRTKCSRFEIIDI